MGVLGEDKVRFQVSHLRREVRRVGCGLAVFRVWQEEEEDEMDNGAGAGAGAGWRGRGGRYHLELVIHPVPVLRDHLQPAHGAKTTE